MDRKDESRSEERLVAENRLEHYKTGPQPNWVTDTGILFGFAVVLIGFVLLILIAVGQFFY